jgi:hypothetical protein
MGKSYYRIFHIEEDDLGDNIITDSIKEVIDYYTDLAYDYLYDNLDEKKEELEDKLKQYIKELMNESSSLYLVRHIDGENKRLFYDDMFNDSIIKNMLKTILYNYC